MKLVRVESPGQELPALLVSPTTLRGALSASLMALPRMLERGYGRISHVASIAGKEGNPNMVAYSATKAGLIGMVKTRGKEYAGFGITITFDLSGGRATY
jgi:2-dehydro-3-deoxy-L-rhamnonate dehydrogenase (NAD+)